MSVKPKTIHWNADYDILPTHQPFPSIGRTVPLLNPPQSPHTIFPPPLATLLNQVLSRLSGHSDPIVLEPFDVTLWYSGVPQTPNLLKVSSDIESDFRNGFFNTLHIDLKVELNF